MHTECGQADEPLSLRGPLGLAGLPAAAKWRRIRAAVAAAQSARFMLMSAARRSLETKIGLLGLSAPLLVLAIPGTPGQPEPKGAARLVALLIGAGLDPALYGALRCSGSVIGSRPRS